MEYDKKSLWQEVYHNRASETLSWFQAHDSLSLEMIEQAGLELDESILDVGGGASTLVDDLLSQGYTRLSVLDISANALELAKRRLAEKAALVHWIEGDIAVIELPESSVSLWHDRAVFHFLTEEEDRNHYVHLLTRAVKSGGQVIIATFAEDGPERCSGQPVRRYSVAELTAELGENFILERQQKHIHKTPAGVEQKFNYCRFQLLK